MFIRLFLFQSLQKAFNMSHLEYRKVVLKRLGLICFWLLLISVLGMTKSMAQVNVEQNRTQNHEGLNVSVDGALTLIRGNVSLSQTGLATKLGYNKGVHSPFVQLSIYYGEKEEQAFLDQAFAHARWTAMWLKHFGSELFAQVQEDSFRSLVLRQLYGGGMRGEFLSDPNHSFALGVGAMYEREHYQELNSDLLEKVIEHNLRLTNYLSTKHKLQGTTEIQVAFTLYYQPRIDTLKDYRVLTDLSFEIKLSEHIRLVESLNLMYDSEPPKTVKHTDLKSLSSLRIVF